MTNESAPALSPIARALALAATHRVATKAKTTRGVARALKGAGAFRARPFPPLSAPRLARVQGAQIGFAREDRRAAPLGTPGATPRARWLHVRSATRRRAWLDAKLRAVGVTPIAEAREQIAARDREIGQEIARDLESRWPHRQASGSWAGGEHSVAVGIIRSWVRPSGTLNHGPRAECTGNRAWSSNGKWSGLNSQAALRVTPRAVALLGTRGMIIDGRIILDASRDGSDLWVLATRQGRGFAIETERGLIVAGEFIPGADPAAARRTYLRRAKAALTARLAG